MARETIMRVCTRDLIVDTSDLSAEEYGAYMLLMMYIGVAGGTAPFDLERMQRVAKVRVSRWDGVWKWVSRFFVVEGEVVRPAVDYIGFRYPVVSDGVTYGGAWRTIRAQIIERDGGRCSECDAGDDLDVHHIRPLRLFDGDLEAAHAPANLVTLCRSCHSIADHAFRRREREG